MQKVFVLFFVLFRFLLVLVVVVLLVFVLAVAVDVLMVFTRSENFPRKFSVL